MSHSRLTKKVNASSLVEHALNLHDPSVSGRASSFLSISERFPQGATDPQGKPLFQGEKLYINLDKLQSESNYIPHEELIAQVAEQHPKNPYIKNNPIYEREGLAIERIPAGAIESGATIATRRLANGLGVLGVGVTAYNLTSATIESVDKGTPVPVAKQVAREAGGWAGALVGAKIGAGLGALAGIETGPGAILTGLAGGLIFGTAGYLGASWALGDFN